MNAQPHDIAAMESLLAFWRDAGVDACYGDAPIDHTHVAPPPAVKAVQRATASVMAMKGDPIYPKSAPMACAARIERPVAMDPDRAS